jgi:hypothetical protein
VLVENALLLNISGQVTRPLEYELSDFAPLDMRLSSEQRAAVAAALSSRVGDPFVLLQGAAGSGKTDTIVEMVRQALRRGGDGDRGTRVLLCAPSNGAADVLALRLVAALQEPGRDGRFSLLRLNSFQRFPNEVMGAGALAPFCCLDVAGFHSIPTLSDLLSASVVVSTCACAGWMRDVHGDAYSPHMIIVDEAAQAVEPELLIPLSLASATETRCIVLCGDCFQLGPTLRSADSIRLGFARSALERLCSSEFYGATGVFPRRCVAFTCFAMP